MVLVIFRHGHHSRLKHEEKITLALSASNYFAIFMNTTTLSATNIETLMGDLYDYNFYSARCIFEGYWIAVSVYTMYCTFVLEAVFRLCRVVYSNHVRLQSYPVFVISTPVLITLGCVLLCPTLVWHDIIYLPNNHYCFLPLIQLRALFLPLSICYLLPYSFLLMVYIRITVYLRQQSGNLAVVIQRRRQQRDLQAIRRIYINVALLCTISLPGMVVIIISLITRVEHPLSYRIIWLGVEVSTAVLSITMILMTPQLRNITIGRWQRNRVTTFEVAVEMRPATIEGAVETKPATIEGTAETKPATIAQ